MLGIVSFPCPTDPPVAKMVFLGWLPIRCSETSRRTRQWRQTVRILGGVDARG
jgi:hypothetical protein